MLGHPLSISGTIGRLFKGLWGILLVDLARDDPRWDQAGVGYGVAGDSGCGLNGIFIKAMMLDWCRSREINNG